MMPVFAVVPDVEKSGKGLPLICALGSCARYLMLTIALADCATEIQHHFSTSAFWVNGLELVRGLPVHDDNLLKSMTASCKLFS